MPCLLPMNKVMNECLSCKQGRKELLMSSMLRKQEKITLMDEYIYKRSFPRAVVSCWMEVG